MEENKNTPLLVGCGGVGAWVAHVLARSPFLNELILMDRDKVEAKNLQRQLFARNEIMLPKAEAIARTLRTINRDLTITTVCEYLQLGATPELLNIRKPSHIIVAVDNHPARLAALDMADRLNIPTILSANETTSSEAYYYDPDWVDTDWDPRKYYPEISTDKADDPTRPACDTAEQVEANPQLPVANFGAADKALWLYQFWTTVAPALPEDRKYWKTAPIHVTSTDGRQKVWTLGEENEHRDHYSRPCSDDSDD